MPRDPNIQLRSQLEGQHSVAAELCARGYIPTVLPERTHMCDLLVLSPAGESFAVEVKANRERNSWFCKRPADDAAADTWVFVELHPQRRFYVLTKGEVQQECDTYQREKPRNAGDEGFKASQLDRHADKWEKLPA